jgi:arsenite methyltransferase
MIMKPKQEPTMEHEELRQHIRENYGVIATEPTGGCCTPSSKSGVSCCGDSAVQDVTVSLGYSETEASSAPAESNLGLGCGNPLAIASLREGETVLDLGSGGGFDCFLASERVGPSGRVIGVDMTPEMIARARRNATKVSVQNVEFRLGEIEHLPVPDSSVDVIISNCVINLSPEKPQVFRDAFRVLRPGGRLAISDVVACIPLPKEFTNDVSLISSCIGGASTIPELERMLADAGFENIHILPKAESKRIVTQWAPGMKLDDIIVSASIEAVKPVH